jgi:ferredoxin-type protein NapH
LKRYLQLALQILFLALFVFLIISGNVQLWMGLFVLSVLAIFLLGRVYCGWICPINTVMRGITWVKKKLRIKSIKTPAWMTKPWVRIFVLALFIAVFIFTMVSGKKLPVLPALLIIGAALTLFFSEELWHRYLCPYGTLMSLAARKSKYAMSIQPERCNSCGMCIRACPAKAVEKREDHYQILKKDCIVCMDCSNVCKQEAIHYRQVF